MPNPTMHQRYGFKRVNHEIRTARNSGQEPHIVAGFYTLYKNPRLFFLTPTEHGDTFLTTAVQEQETALDSLWRLLSAHGIPREAVPNGRAHALPAANSERESMQCIPSADTSALYIPLGVGTLLRPFGEASSEAVRQGNWCAFNQALTIAEQLPQIDQRSLHTSMLHRLDELPTPLPKL